MAHSAARTLFFSAINMHITAKLISVVRMLEIVHEDRVERDPRPNTPAQGTGPTNTRRPRRAHSPGVMVPGANPARASVASGESRAPARAAHRGPQASPDIPARSPAGCPGGGAHRRAVAPPHRPRRSAPTIPPAPAR
jgi:hypothetical protein